MDLPGPYELKIHGKPTPSTVTSLKTFDFERRAPLDTPIRVGVAAENDTLGFYRDGQLIGTVVDDTFSSGRPALGIFQKDNGAAPRTACRSPTWRSRWSTSNPEAVVPSR